MFMLYHYALSTKLVGTIVYALPKLFAFYMWFKGKMGEELVNITPSNIDYKKLQILEAYDMYEREKSHR